MPRCQGTKFLGDAMHFLRMSAWKTTDEPSLDTKPKASAVAKWNRRNKDQKVYLNDIILLVNGLSPLHDGQNLLEKKDIEDTDMRVSLQVLSGFVTFPSLEECTGKTLNTFTVTFEAGDPNSPITLWQKLKMMAMKKTKWFRRQGKKKAKPPAERTRVSSCERFCLADVACDAVQVVISLESDGTTKVLCHLMQNDEIVDESVDIKPKGDAQLTPMGEEQSHEHTCWMRTRLAGSSQK